MHCSAILAFFICEKAEADKASLIAAKFTKQGIGRGSSSKLSSFS